MISFLEWYVLKFLNIEYVIEQDYISNWTAQIGVLETWIF